jgi:hypothetical protein
VTSGAGDRGAVGRGMILASGVVEIGLIEGERGKADSCSEEVVVELSGNKVSNPNPFVKVIEGDLPVIVL